MGKNSCLFLALKLMFWYRNYKV